MFYLPRQEKCLCCTKTKCQPVASIKKPSPQSQKTGLFSPSSALSHCPAEFLSNNPEPELLHSWIPPGDLRELTIGKTFQLREYKEGPCERSEPTNGAVGMWRNRLWPHNKATQGISTIKGWGLLFFHGSRSDILLPPNMKTSASCALSPHGWNRDESIAGSDGINSPDFINKLDRCRQSVSRRAIKGLQKDTVLSSHPDTPIHLRVD